MSDDKQLTPDGKTRLLTAWIALAFTVVGILGLTLAPGARFVWVLILIFGLVAVPQVIFWREPAREHADRRKEADRQSDRR